MAFPQTYSPTHQYSEAIRLKLYQAFIFSIPILFAIILILLFYLFYLKRRSSASPILAMTVNDANVATVDDMKDELKDKLCAVMFDEYTKKRDSQCSVCLGEYEEKEELVQVASCKHVFHVECIHHWLRYSSTCPLCRTLVVDLNLHQQPMIH